MDYYSMGVKAVFPIQFYEYKAAKALEVPVPEFTYETEPEPTQESQLLDIVRRLQTENRALQEENSDLKQRLERANAVQLRLTLPEPEHLLYQESFFYKEIIKQLCAENLSFQARRRQF